jgi:hypothetical protein
MYSMPDPKRKQQALIAIWVIPDGPCSGAFRRQGWAAEAAYR